MAATRACLFVWGLVMAATSASGRNAGNVAANAKAERECRERFMKTFAKRYAHRFEFLGGRTSSKGKATLRCKVCGNVFEVWGSFAQQDVNTRCPRCHVCRDDTIGVPSDGRLVERMADMYALGIKTEGIAEMTGIERRTVRKLLKENGVEFDTTRYGRVSKQNRRRRAQACRETMAQFDQLREEMKEADAPDILKAAAGRIDADCRGFGKTAALVGTYAPTWATCVHCGKPWLFFPSTKRYGRKKPVLYCSHRCRVKENKTNSNIGHRLRKYGSEDKPRDVIRLDELIDRDGGVCYICGCETQKSDHEYRHGFFTIGDKYPTIDHVIPLAKGGTHTWRNVRLACRRCNSTKADSLCAPPKGCPEHAFDAPR